MDLNCMANWQLGPSKITLDEDGMENIDDFWDAMDQVEEPVQKAIADPQAGWSDQVISAALSQRKLHREDEPIALKGAAASHQVKPAASKPDAKQTPKQTPKQRGRPKKALVVSEEEGDSEEEQPKPKPSSTTPKRTPGVQRSNGNRPSSGRKSVSSMNVDDILQSLSQDPPSEPEAARGRSPKKQAKGRRKLYKPGAALLQDVPDADDLIDQPSPTMAFDQLRLQPLGKQVAKSKAAKPKSKPARKYEDEDNEDESDEGSSRKRRKQVARISRVEKVATPEQEGAGRRGTRKRVKPLEFWNNEMAVYNADGGMQEVIHRDEEDSPSPVLKKRKELKRSTPKSVGKSKKGKSKRGAVTPGYSEEELEEDIFDEDELEAQGFHQEVTPMAIVKDALSGEDLQVPIVKSAKMLDFAQLDDSSLCAKSFGGMNWTCEVLLIPPQTRTSTGSTDNQTMVCVVLSGQIQVSVHKSHFVLAMGGHFFVPPKNIYAIRNLSQSRDCRIHVTKFNTIESDRSASA